MHHQYRYRWILVCFLVLVTSMFLPLLPQPAHAQTMPPPSIFPPVPPPSMPTPSQEPPSGAAAVDGQFETEARMAGPAYPGIVAEGAGHESRSVGFLSVPAGMRDSFDITASAQGAMAGIPPYLSFIDTTAWIDVKPSSIAWDSGSPRQQSHPLVSSAPPETESTTQSYHFTVPNTFLPNEGIDIRFRCSIVMTMNDRGWCTFSNLKFFRDTPQWYPLPNRHATSAMPSPGLTQHNIHVSRRAVGSISPDEGNFLALNLKNHFTEQYYSSGTFQLPTLVTGDKLTATFRYAVDYDSTDPEQYRDSIMMWLITRDMNQSGTPILGDWPILGATPTQNEQPWETASSGQYQQLNINGTNAQRFSGASATLVLSVPVGPGLPPRMVGIDAIQLYLNGQPISMAPAPPRAPQLIAPAHNSTLHNRAVTFQWQDMGDPDNLPRARREFYLELWDANGYWRTVRNWRTQTDITIEVPGTSTYGWRVLANDGALLSPWSATQYVTVGNDGLHTDTRYWAVIEPDGETSIYLKICGKGEHHRLYVKDLTPGQAPWNKPYGRIDGCVTGSDYHGVVNGVPGDRFTFYTTVSNSELSDEAFFARAKKRSCTIMASGRPACLDGETAPAFTPQPPAGGGAQLDVTYVDQVYAQKTLNPDTGKWDYCGPSTLAMLLLYNHAFASEVVYAKTTEFADRIRISDGRTHWEELRKEVERAGFEASHNYDTDIALSPEELVAILKAGQPIAVSWGHIGHIVLIVGAKGEGNTLKFAVHDPFGGAWIKEDWQPIFEENEYDNDIVWGETNQPAAEAPKQKGKMVWYTYEKLEEYGLGQYVWIINRRTGSSSTIGPVAGALQRSASSESLILAGDEFEARFPATSADLTITHTSHISLSNALPNGDQPLTAFRLSAASGDGQALSRAELPFDMTIGLDPATVDAFGMTEDGPSNAAPPELALMAWNATSQQWERVPAAVDLPSYRVTAQVDRFTEYAVVPLDAPAGTPLPTVSMAAPGMGVYEHDQKALVEVRLSQPMGQVAQVDYSTATVPGNGGLIVGATPGVDYTAVSGRLIFLPGEVSKTITVPIRDPEIADAEPGERFAVVLSNPSGIALGSQSRNEITIGANDGLSWGTLQTAGDEGTTIALTVRLNGPSNASVQVAYATRIGTATQPDFGARAGTLTFAPGETVKTISFKLAADPWDEPDETFWVDLSVPVNAQITGTASAKVIIRAIPTLPSLMEK